MRTLPRIARPADDACCDRPGERAAIGGDERAQDERRGDELVEDLAVEVDVVPDEVRVQRGDDGGERPGRAREHTRTDGVDEECRARATRICAKPTDHQFRPKIQ